MKKIITDSGIVIKWCVSEFDSAQAKLIYDEYEAGRLEFLAPSLLPAEVGNIIWKKRIFQSLSEINAEDAIKIYQQVAFTLTQISLLFDDAYQIAIKYKRTFYDSLYLALSVRENCEFVTADEKFYNAVRANFSNIILLSSWQ